MRGASARAPPHRPWFYNKGSVEKSELRRMFTKETWSFKGKGAREFCRSGAHMVGEMKGRTYENCMHCTGL